MYGLIVIGDDLSSHITAAIASFRGIKTALIAENGMAGSCTVGDLVFNTDNNPVVGLGENQFLFSLLKEWGVSPQFNVLNPAYQIILPECRLDFFNDKETLVKELVREFPDLVKDIKSYYDTVEKISEVAEKWLHRHPLIQPKNFREYVDYIKLTPYFIKHKLNNMKLKRLVSQNASFHKVMEAQKVLLSFRTNHQSSIFSDFHYSAPLRGVYNFPQGKQFLFDLLINKIEAADGLYINRCEVLSVKKGKSIEVTYMDKNDAASKIESNNLIVSTKWQNMHLIIDRKKKFSFGDFIRPTKISHYPFTIHLGVNPQCLPEKMAKHVAVISDVRKDIYDDNLIILESGAFHSEENQTAVKNPLSATVFLPDNQNIWSRDGLNQIGASIIERLEYFLPFLKENVEFFDSEESINISLKQRNVINPKYQIRNAVLSGFAAKNNKTKFRNIYLTGASLLLDAGLEGEVLSGINAAACVVIKKSQ